ncbi:centrosomal protein of 44 kDa [Hippocampus comes]|uniref:centrosomal protein of 44 kDa n=1 Tax=Hippocampus comes TaxID=109280 RepID=UPI00094F32EB|nr:PREDICTED: centrosomal protein of 44 kDa [Hippocampus comes]XP_019735384.1 PREDICTED: centrosomal protein of 44 kDa [Hippocampus comes]
MLPTGDVQGCLRKLETLLRIVKYPGPVDYNGLSVGDPSAFLPILSFSLTTFSPPFAEQLVAAGLELTGKTDLRFTDTLYKVLRDIFHYKPIISKQQFLQRGFVQRKISTLCDIIDLVLQRHKELKKPRLRNPVSHKDTRGADHAKLTKPDTVCDWHFVVNHMQDDGILPCQNEVQALHDEVYSSNPPENGNTNLTEKQQEEDDIRHSSEVEQKLSVMEAQIDSLLCGLQRLGALEARLEELASRTNTEKKEEELITISRESWDNLNGRILLLETKLELGHTKSSVPPLCQSSTPLSSLSVISDSSKDDIKDRLERITNMLKSTSTLMKSADSPTTPYE